MNDRATRATGGRADGRARIADARQRRASSAQMVAACPAQQQQQQQYQQQQYQQQSPQSHYGDAQGGSMVYSIRSPAMPPTGRRVSRPYGDQPGDGRYAADPRGPLVGGGGGVVGVSTNVRSTPAGATIRRDHTVYGAPPRDCASTGVVAHMPPPANYALGTSVAYDQGDGNYGAGAVSVASSHQQHYQQQQSLPPFQAQYQQQQAPPPPSQPYGVDRSYGAEPPPPPPPLGNNGANAAGPGGWYASGGVNVAGGANGYGASQSQQSAPGQARAQSTPYTQPAPLVQPQPCSQQAPYPPPPQQQQQQQQPYGQSQQSYGGALAEQAPQQASCAQQQQPQPFGQSPSAYGQQATGQVGAPSYGATASNNNACGNNGGGQLGATAQATSYQQAAPVYGAQPQYQQQQQQQQQYQQSPAYGVQQQQPQPAYGVQQQQSLPLQQQQLGAVAPVTYAAPPEPQVVGTAQVGVAAQSFGAVGTPVVGAASQVVGAPQVVGATSQVVGAVATPACAPAVSQVVGAVAPQAVAVQQTVEVAAPPLSLGAAVIPQQQQTVYAAAVPPPQQTIFAAAPPPPQFFAAPQQTILAAAPVCQGRRNVSFIRHTERGTGNPADDEALGLGPPPGASPFEGFRGPGPAYGDFYVLSRPTTATTLTAGQPVQLTAGGTNHTGLHRRNATEIVLETCSGGPGTFKVFLSASTTNPSQFGIRVSGQGSTPHVRTFGSDTNFVSGMLILARIPVPAFIELVLVSTDGPGGTTTLPSSPGGTGEARVISLVIEQIC